MRTLVKLLVMLLFPSLFALAQRTQLEITNPGPAGTDVMPNNAAVPDSYAIAGQFDHIEVLRFKYQTDLLAGIESLAREQKIINGVILGGIGSVRNYRYHVVSNRTFPSKNLFVSDSTAPADIVNMNGCIINGRVHAHITLADSDRAFGGHLETGTHIFTFAVVTVGILKEGTDLRRVDDKSYR